MKNLRTTLIFSLFVLLTACAPKKQDSMSSISNDVRGTSQQDARLNLGQGLKQEQMSSEYFAWRGQINSSDYYQFINDLIELGLTDKAQALQSLLRQNISAKNSIAFENSPYIQAAIGTQKTSSIEKINEFISLLNSDQNKIIALIQSMSPDQLNVVGPINILTVLEQVQKFLSAFLNKIESLNILPEFKNTLKEEIQNQITSSVLPAKIIAQKITQGQNLLEVVQQIKQLTQTLNLKLEKEQADLVQIGLNLGERINNIKDEQSALTAIIEVWNILTPQERIDTILPFNKALYNYLNDQSDVGLRCLGKTHCLNPYIALAKDLKIFPELKKFGIDKLRGIFQSSAIDFTIKKLNSQSAAALNDFSKTLITKISDGVESKTKQLTDIKNDFDGFVRQTAKKWSLANLPNGQIAGYTTNKLQIDLNIFQSNKSTVNFAATSVLESQSLGAELRVKSKLAELSTANDASKNYLEIINQVLAIGGYTNSQNSPSKNLLIPVDDQPGSIANFSINDVGNIKKQYAMPDQLVLTNAFQANVTEAQNHFSAKSQADLLLGISSVIAQLRDWEKTNYDNSLGTVSLGQIVPELVGSKDQTSVFPKATLLAMAIGNSAVILKNVLQDLSPVFLMSEQSRIIWANEFNFSSQDVTVMAGVVDLKDSQRMRVVHSEDVAHYIIALGEFLKATNGIEQTQSSLLLESHSGDANALSQLVDARRKIKLLMIGLSNFLCHQMADADGGIMSDFSLQDRFSLTAQKKLSDQVIAVKALLVSYETTHIDVYRWAATDAYYFMNKVFFSKLNGFYIENLTSQRALNLAESASTVIALKKIHDYLPQDARIQNELIQNVWVQKLTASN